MSEAGLAEGIQHNQGGQLLYRLVNLFQGTPDDRFQLFSLHAAAMCSDTIREAFRVYLVEEDDDAEGSLFQHIMLPVASNEAETTSMGGCATCRRAFLQYLWASTGYGDSGY